ncbi:zinc finger, ZZ-type, Zinc finger, RING/FYVE/PHD-type [Artemisia annua]|uniref:Zinc finger, ZZ-type, Zinc finger, RING/FYVE/PHD-type n=1 Tax=Artemisia annua TaxID=35608 RepID=A0A2U1Q6D0_ARTAN|nr:zinc finger, ZZ-type, Zinc finger, RING/FYVE/PHD-type [Artemisia annua]
MFDLISVLPTDLSTHRKPVQMQRLLRADWFQPSEDCFNSSSNLPGRFNQQHKPDHEFENRTDVSIALDSSLDQRDPEADVLAHGHQHDPEADVVANGPTNDTVVDQEDSGLTS